MSPSCALPAAENSDIIGEAVQDHPTQTVDHNVIQNNFSWTPLITLMSRELYFVKWSKNR
ncbi:hypothetical protein Plhal304r1_c011g0042411 [Plasmopara halstedii]